MHMVEMVFAYVSAAITFATFALQGLAAITRITPSTADDELLGRAQRWVKQAQRVLGLIALDTASTHKPRRSSNGPGGSAGAAVTSIVVAMVMAVCLAGIGGCAHTPAPQTAKQSLAYTESSYAAAVNTAVRLERAGALSAAQDTRLDDLIQRGNAALAAAHSALGNDQAGVVQGRLATVDAVLVAVRDMIQQEITDGH